EQGLSFGAAVRLDHAHHHVGAVLALGPRLFQHFVGLAHAGRRADENLQLAGRALLASRLREQGFGRRSLIKIAPLIGHRVSRRGCYFPAASSAMLSARTLTRGSPNRPRKRASLCSSTSWGRRSSGMLRALATRGTWNSAASGEISGSRPLPEVVTKSGGIGSRAFSFLSVAMSARTRSISALLEGPRFDPPEFAAL